MISQEDLERILDEWNEGTVNFLILVEYPEAGDEWRILNRAEARALAELIAAKATSDDDRISQLCYNSEEAADMMGVSEQKS